MVFYAWSPFRVKRYTAVPLLSIRKCHSPSLHVGHDATQTRYDSHDEAVKYQKGTVVGSQSNTHTHTAKSVSFEIHPTAPMRVLASLLVLQKLLQSFPVFSGHLDGAGRTGLGNRLGNLTFRKCDAFFFNLKKKGGGGGRSTSGLTSSVPQRWWLSCRWRS